MRSARCDALRALPWATVLTLALGIGATTAIHSVGRLKKVTECEGFVIRPTLPQILPS